MPFVTYFQSRVRSQSLTAADCVDLIFESSVTPSYC